MAAQFVYAATEYTEVEYNALRISLEDYKSKHITYVEAWRNVSGTLPRYPTGTEQVQGNEMGNEMGNEKGTT